MQIFPSPFDYLTSHQHKTVCYDKDLLFITLLFYSCQEDNVNKENVELWSLTNITQGFAATEEYEVGAITWEFKSDGILIIEINTSLKENSLVPFEEGQYSYALSNNVIIIDGSEYDYSESESMLTISQDVASDGPQYTFKK